MTDDVGYVVGGPTGKRCVDCKNYKASAVDPQVGTCAGFDVQASASCNLFEKQEDPVEN